ncbi:hypothetical protein AVEN_153150-1 [Araneus ventricosus]|uniref:Uncharacterized protein n=1 Tax=Araneus ventricosus TaxID=182803 RepID=A0A4Y2MG42_ARAVE|nr:hypothetical protein AVEN_153150-1 [Araneus ventricosus]
MMLSQSNTYKVCPNEKETLAVSALYQIPISTKSSYPISSRRRGACFTNLLQDERGEPYSGGVNVIDVGRINSKDLPRPGQDQQCHDLDCG